MRLKRKTEQNNNARIYGANSNKMAKKGERSIFGVNTDPKQAQAASVKKRKENASRRAAIIAAFKSDGMTAQDAAMFDAMLLMATRAELSDIAKNESLPADIRRRARMMMRQDDKEAVQMGETLRDRAFGKPKQIAEVDGNLQTEQTMIFTGLPDPKND